MGNRIAEKVGLILSVVHVTVSWLVFQVLFDGCGIVWPHGALAKELEVAKLEFNSIKFSQNMGMLWA